MSYLSVSFLVRSVLYPDGVLLVHLVVDADVLIRLLPYTGDPDLFAVTGENREVLINRLKEVSFSLLVYCKKDLINYPNWNWSD